MNDGVSHHPEVEVMAAFIEGKLAPSEVSRIAAHLRGCGDCRTVVGETARFEREELAKAEPRVRTGTVRAWWLAAAAAVGGAIALTAPLLMRTPATVARAPIQILIDAAPLEHRTVEARLSGFPWAPPKVSQRSPLQADPAELKLGGAAGIVLDQTNRKEDPAALHAKGLAHLLIHETTKGIEALERAAKASNDARMWSDLAAARYALAVNDDRTSVLADALAAADTAIRIDGSLPEAHFNRALILESLAIRDGARKAWQEYLLLDGSSGWSSEARHHLRQLEQGRPSASTFESELKLARGSLQAGDRSAVGELVKRFPQESRMWGEGPLLTDWADAEAAGDVRLAAERLDLVRAIGDALVEQSAEAFLHDAVESIDRADARTRTRLAGAFLIYRRARSAYGQRRIESATLEFRRAEALFLADGNLMAGMVSSYAARAAFDGGNGAGAAAALTRLRERINHSRHRALSAQIAWDLARDAVATGDWGTAAREAAASASAFLEIGERDHGAFAEAIAAHALERMGNSDQAWQRRVSALRSMTNAERQRATLHSASLALAASDRIDAAAAVLGILIEEGRGNPELLARALTDRARLAERGGDLAAAGGWLAEARRAAAAISETGLRATTDAQIDLASAGLSHETDPRNAIATLDRVITFFADHDGGARLPEAHLQRARAYRASGNIHAAIADYQTAAREIAKQRGSIGAGDARLSFLDGATETIEETIQAHLSVGAVAEAFSVADRARALFERSGSPIHLAPRTALIEYALLPDSIAIFCLTPAGIVVETTPVDRRGLNTQLTSFVEEIRNTGSADTIRSAATTLHRLLIAPIQKQLIGIDEIVIVPDRQLHAIPFALLYDQRTGRYLVQDFTIRLAPSANAVRHDASDSLTPAFVIGNPVAENTGLARLPHSRAEAEQVAAMHGATLIGGREATRARFLEALANGALVHYAGHADSDRAESYGALLLAPADGHNGILGAAEIARLPLRLNKPLVVLSACGTFRGETTHVGGMPSLARAFLAAGARAVVGTLWEIEDDVTAPLFIRFHTHLRARLAPARALRQAQIDMLQSSDPRLRHPSTWSPVEVLSNF